MQSFHDQYIINLNIIKNKFYIIFYINYDIYKQKK